MTPDELEQFLTTERTVRLGTASADGEPHVAPLWFVWLDGAMYLNSLKRSRRGRDVEAGSRVAACVDAGFEYAELRGAVLYGVLEDATGDPNADEARKIFGTKYFHGIDIPVVKSHAWLRLRPDRIVSWDFKKIPSGRDRRVEALRDQ
jgi:general stress protein 26